MLTLGVLFPEEKQEIHPGPWSLEISGLFYKNFIWKTLLLNPEPQMVCWIVVDTLFVRNIGLKKSHLICYWVNLFIPNIYIFWLSKHEAERCEIIQAIHILNSPLIGSTIGEFIYCPFQSQPITIEKDYSLMVARTFLFLSKCGWKGWQKGVWSVSQMLTMADKGGRRDHDPL